MMTVLCCFSCSCCLHTSRIWIKINYIIKCIYYIILIIIRGVSSGEGGLVLGDARVVIVTRRCWGCEGCIHCCCRWGVGEATQGQRTQEPTTQVTLRRRGWGQDSSNEQKPKESSNRESLGTRLRVLYTTEHVLNMWYTCGVHVGMTSKCYVRSETSRD